MSFHVNNSTELGHLMLKRPELKSGVLALKPVQDFELEDQYDDYLDDIYSDQQLAWIKDVDVARCLKEAYPTDYRVGLSEFTNDLEENGELVYYNYKHYWREDVNDIINGRYVETLDGRMDHLLEVNNE